MCDNKEINEQVEEQEKIDINNTEYQENECSETKYKERLEKINKEKEDLDSKYLRLAADFQNFKKRTENERSEIYSFANEKIILDLLDVIDNFDRALLNVDNDNETDKSFLEGIDMIYKQFIDVLKKYGVSEIEAQNKEFDPNYHNAVLKESRDDVDSEIVVQVLQKGYILNGKVIRPSMVKVSE